MVVLKVIGKFFAVIFSIIVFSLLLCGTISLIAINFVSKENFSVIVQNINLKEMIVEEDFYGNKITIGDKIAEEFEYSDIDENIITNVLDIPEVKEVLGDFAGEYFEYLFKRNELPQINDEDIQKILNSKDLEEIIGKKLTEKDQDDLKNVLKEIQYEVNEAVENSMDEENYKDEFDDLDQKYIKYFLSSMFIVGIILSIIIFIVLIAICTWSIYKFLIWVGIPAIIAGIMLLLIGLLPNALLNVASMNEEFIADELLLELSASLLNKFVLSGIILIIVGIIMIVCYCLIKNKLYKKEVYVSEKEFIGNKFCPNCGAVITSKFCVNCGQPKDGEKKAKIEKQTITEENKETKPKVKKETNKDKAKKVAKKVDKED